MTDQQDLLPAPAQELLRALDQRLLAAAQAALGPDSPSVPSGPTSGARPGSVAAAVLPRLVAACRGPLGTEVAWLLLTAVRGRFPSPDELDELTSSLELDPNASAVIETRLLDLALDSDEARPDLEMTVITDHPVVEVDFSARNDLHTGIHRVVRETLPRWAEAHRITPVAWIDESTAFRALAPRERQRVLDFGRESTVDLAEEAVFRHRLVVPWRTTVILPDVPSPGASSVMTSLARWSGNKVMIIGYDLIPITSADTRPFSDATVAAAQLTVVKHASRVAGISASAATEYEGFVHALQAQGLDGPEVREVFLPESAPPVAASCEARAAGSRPVLLAPGTLEPHKNHRTILHAAERLWHEGLDFELRMMGSAGWSSEIVQRTIDRLTEQGRPVRSLGRVSEEELWEQLSSADVVVFISLHEGYGLPVSEALSVGTPVLTSSFGSQAEIARNGGCLLVDPRDDDAVTGAMRALITDEALRDRLADEARRRPPRTWDDYAGELWQYFMTDETAGDLT
jgi:glycosyltransferase involved in cell wall biosynthesis